MESNSFGMFSKCKAMLIILQPRDVPMGKLKEEIYTLLIANENKEVQNLCDFSQSLFLLLQDGGGEAGEFVQSAQIPEKPNHPIQEGWKRPGPSWDNWGFPFGKS